MNVDLRQLRAFLTVADQGSFTRAAEALHMTQPTLSVIIRDLEEALGLRLFDRTTRTVSLTAAGQALLPDARRLLRDLDTALGELRTLAELRKGTVRLAVLPSVATSLMPRVLTRFWQLHPDIEVRLQDCPAEGVIEAVKSAEVDLGIGVLIPPLVAELDSTVIAEDSLVAALPPDHWLAHHASLPWRQLQGERLIAMNTGTSVRHLMDMAATSLNRPLQFRLEVRYMSSAIAMAQAGLGITILPSLGVEGLAATSLVIRPLTEPVITRPIVLLQRRDRWLPPAAESFKALLTEVAGREKSF